MVPFEIKLVYGFIFAFYSNYGRILSRFDAVHERDRHPATQRSTHLPQDSKGRAYG